MNTIQIFQNGQPVILEKSSTHLPFIECFLLNDLAWYHEKMTGLTSDQWDVLEECYNQRFTIMVTGDWFLRFECLQQHKGYFLYGKYAGVYLATHSRTLFTQKQVSRVIELGSLIRPTERNE